MKCVAVPLKAMGEGPCSQGVWADWACSFSFKGRQSGDLDSATLALGPGSADASYVTSTMFFTRFGIWVICKTEVVLKE